MVRVYACGECVSGGGGGGGGGAEGGVVVCASNINILVNIARGMGEGCVAEGAEEGCAGGGGGGGGRGGGGEVAGVVGVVEEHANFSSGYMMQRFRLSGFKRKPSFT